MIDNTKRKDTDDDSSPPNCKYDRDLANIAVNVKHTNTMEVRKNAVRTMKGFTWIALLTRGPMDNPFRSPNIMRIPSFFAWSLDCL